MGRVPFSLGTKFNEGRLQEYDASRGVVCVTAMRLKSKI